MHGQGIASVLVRMAGPAHEPFVGSLPGGELTFSPITRSSDRANWVHD